jgi:hypothetical protein
MLFVRPDFLLPSCAMNEEGTSAVNLFQGGDMGLGFELVAISLIRRLLVGGSLPSSALLPSSPFSSGVRIDFISSESGRMSKPHDKLVACV